MNLQSGKEKQKNKNHNERLSEITNAGFKGLTFVSDIVKELCENDQKCQKIATENIKHLRRQKTQQCKRSKFRDIYNECMKPGSAVPRVFSSSKPLNPEGKYLDEKEKSHVTMTDRAFGHEANSKFIINSVVTGVPRERTMTDTKSQKKDWINRKFCDFDTIVTQQVGPMRMLVRKRTLQANNIVEKRTICSGMLNTKNHLFSDFEGESVNFYHEHDKMKTMENFSKKMKTESSVRSLLGSNQSNRYQNESKNFGSTIKSTATRNTSTAKSCRVLTNRYFCPSQPYMCYNI